MPKRKLAKEEKTLPSTGDDGTNDAYADTDTEMDDQQVDQQEQQQSNLFRLSSRVKSMKRRGMYNNLFTQPYPYPPLPTPPSQIY